MELMDAMRDRRSVRRYQDREVPRELLEELLTAACWAPSAENTQPWYFKHSPDGFDVYQVKHNIIKRQFVKKWNPIDVGIALAHMYVANEDTFEFYRKADFEKINGHIYAGSIKI